MYIPITPPETSPGHFDYFKVVPGPAFTITTVLKPKRPLCLAFVPDFGFPVLESHTLMWCID